MASFHSRSNSLPSTSHPFVTEFNEKLCRLKASEIASSSSSFISHKLSGLQDLHECVEKFLLPFSQQALAQECGDKGINELLDGSLRLLDVCGIIKDALASRKDVKKAMNKAFKVKESQVTDKNHETPAAINMLKELDEVTVAVFESLLSYIAGSKSKSSRWSLVSKLVQPKRVSCEGEEAADINELEKVDAALHSLISHNKSSKSGCTAQAENAQNLLQELGANIQDIEEGLECLFRRLIKARVSLLNIFNH